jgi:hypothetical protein
MNALRLTGLVGALIALVVGLVLPRPSFADDETTCQDPQWVYNYAKEDMEEYRIAAFDGKFLELMEAWGCHGPADPVMVARIFLLQAWRYSQDAQHDESVYAPFVWTARALAPEEWVDGPKAEVKALWESSKPPGFGKLVVSGLPKGGTLLIDGAKASGEKVAAGAHIVQVLDADGKVQKAWLIRIDPDRTQTVVMESESGLQIGPQVIEVRESKGINRAAFLGAGISTAVVGGGGVAASWAVAHKHDRDSGAGTALIVTNTAGWCMVGIGAGLTAIGLIPQGSKVSVGPGSILINGKF